MKAKKFLVSALSLASLLMLVGCEETITPSTDQTGTPNIPAQTTLPTSITTATSNAVVNILPGNTEAQITSQTEKTTVPAATTAPEVSMADQSAYNGAMQLKDPSFCDKIRNEDYKKACKTALLDLQANNDAVTKMDSSLCAKLSSRDAQEACKTEVEVALKKVQQEADNRTADEKNSLLANEIQQSGNLSRCKELADANQISVCELNMLVNKALQAKDIAICKQASTDQTIKACQNTVKSMPQ